MSQATNLTPDEARQVVLQIARKKGWISERARENSDPETLIALENVREELADAVEIIARDINSQKERFVLELIQNAEDNEFKQARHLGKDPQITFDVHADKIVVECNEDGFSEANVKSICRTGKSSKKAKRGYIGEKGIGFKSVFQVASKVHIQSNSFSFSFQYDQGSRGAAKLGIITPIPEDDLIPTSDRPLTRMTLTPISGIPYCDLASNFLVLPDTLLLFLSTIKILKIQLNEFRGKTIIATYRKINSMPDIVDLIKTVEVLGHPNETVITETQYHVTTKTISNLTAHEARPDVNECDVVLAFPLNKDFSPVISTHFIYAFLPVRESSFTFLIQADFILDASRQDVVVSDRNRDILKGVAMAFRDAVLNFSRSSPPLRYQWMRFLPMGPGLDTFWKTLSSNIIELLSNEDILSNNDSSLFFRPDQLRTLPSSCLDKNGSPLFKDRPGKNGKYLSHLYSSDDIKTLAQAFKIKDIEDQFIYYRIKQDLSKDDSRIRDRNTDNDWHSRTADLLSAMLLRSQNLANQIKELKLIPLIDGRWVDASENDLFFPLESGPEIPRDLLVTVSPDAVENTLRKEMLGHLGVSRCSIENVLDRLRKCYSSDEVMPDLASSVAHLRFLYWNYNGTDDRIFWRIWLYDTHGRKVTSRHKLMYLQSIEEYSPQQLLKSVEYRTRPNFTVPECPVPFIHTDYMEAFPPTVRRHELSWLDWLEKALGLQRITRLKHNMGSLSPEFRHIIEYRPDKLVGALKANWNTYEDEITHAITTSLSDAKVDCQNCSKTALRDSYLPLPSLVRLSHDLGIVKGIPFLQIPNDSERRLIREWGFLQDFGVGIEANINFHLWVLLEHQRQSFELNERLRDNVLKTYESIVDCCSNLDQDELRSEFEGLDVILSPRNFELGTDTPKWIYVSDCVWEGPTNLLTKEPLASISVYRDNSKLQTFFCQNLGIVDATWKDYLEALKFIQEGNSHEPNEDVSEKVLRLYGLFSRCIISNEDWNTISDSFEENALIYDSSLSTWFSPSDCLWTSPTKIEGKSIVGDCYNEDLKAFFVTHLSIPQASLSTIVDELNRIVQENASVEDVKKMIWAINSMNPAEGDLDDLLTRNVLPIRQPVGEILLRPCSTAFAVNDRAKLHDVFKLRIPLLDFTLEQIQQLHPFIHAINLHKNYLSVLCHEETACEREGSEVDEELTRSFHERAYYLMRCAVSYLSPLVTGNLRSLYDRLLSVSVRKSDGIMTKYICTLSGTDEEGGEVRGYLHIASELDQLEIYVPKDKRRRDLSYLQYLPEALTKVLQISSSSREIIGKILNGSVWILDELLMSAGVGEITGVDAFPLSYPEISDEGEVSAEIQRSSAPLRSSRSRSAPLLIQGQGSIETHTRNPPMSRTDQTSILTPSGSLLTPEPDITPSNSPSPQPSSLLPSFPSRMSVHRDSRRVDFHVENEYLELLDYVIQISNRSTLPYNGAIDLEESVEGSFYEGYNHEAIFGVRSQDQMGHDKRIGAAGELYVFEMLSKLNLPFFDFNNWESTIRGEVTIHPSYAHMGPWPGSVETADITYEDDESALTELLIKRHYLPGSWAGITPKYFIEVKTTTSTCDTRFFMSNNQYQRMQNMALTPEYPSPEVYLIFRVFNLSKSNMDVKIYINPERQLQFIPQTWTVTPSQS